MNTHGAKSMEHSAEGRGRRAEGLNPIMRHAPCAMLSSCPLPSAGFTYIALLAALVIIGITLGAAGKYWQNVMLREKEEELLFRGDQYRRAIEKYYTSLPGRQQLPPSIDDLLKDSRSAAGKRHLRRKYKDPITGEDFEEIRDKLRGNRIVGVRSKSDKKPLKQANFPDLYKDFENKGKYSEWEFKLGPQTFQPLPPGQQIFTQPK